MNEMEMQTDIIRKRLNMLQQRKVKVLPYLQGLRDGSLHRMMEDRPDQVLYWIYRGMEQGEGC